MTPAPADAVEAWLAELSVLVVRRADDEFGDALRLEAYASRLRQYPADVARAALLDRPWKFWPAWQELEAVCEALVSPRRHMLRALRFPALAAPEEAPQQRPTPESARAIMDAAGFTAKRMGAVAKAPTARSMDEAEARVERSRAPHWTETAPPDDPKWAELERARAANPLIAAMRAKAARAAE